MQFLSVLISKSRLGGNFLSTDNSPTDDNVSLRKGVLNGDNIPTEGFTFAKQICFGQLQCIENSAECSSRLIIICNFSFP